MPRSRNLSPRVNLGWIVSGTDRFSNVVSVGWFTRVSQAPVIAGAFVFLVTRPQRDRTHQPLAHWLLLA